MHSAGISLLLDDLTRHAEGSHAEIRESAKAILKEYERLILAEKRVLGKTASGGANDRDAG